MPLDPSLTPLRCVCPSRSMLAAYGLDSRGKIYLDIKVYKQHRVYSHTQVFSGRVRILCPSCGRWHTVRISQRERKVLLSPDPERLPTTDAVIPDGA